MRSSCLKIAWVVGAAFLALTLAAPAFAAAAPRTAPATLAHHTINANAAVLTGQGCNPNPFANQSECTKVVGTGTYIDYIQGWLVNKSTFTEYGVHIEAYGPNGHIANCPQFTLHPYGQSPTCTVNIYQNAAAGDYCTRAWQLQGSRYTVLSAECVNVHP